MPRKVARNLPNIGVALANLEWLPYQKMLQQSIFPGLSLAGLGGVELAGLSKNIIAIASGITQGLGFGTIHWRSDDPWSCRISRDGVRLVLDPLTFAGLSGIGIW